MLLVSPSCGASNDPRLVEAWHKAVEKVRASGADGGVVVTLTGVSVTMNPEWGISFLDRFGPFHEVLAGRGWQGVGAREFLSGSLTGPPAVPQIVMVERDYWEGPLGETQLHDEHVIQRRIGLGQILAWTEN